MVLQGDCRGVLPVLADESEPCILAGCPVGGTVLDPFGGAGTTALVAKALNREYLLCELSPEYVKLSRSRL